LLSVCRVFIKNFNGVNSLNRD